MAGAIRGIDPRENVYTYAHKAGRHFRTRATEKASPRVSISIDKHGIRTQFVTIPLRRGKTARTLGLRPVGLGIDD